MKIGVMLDSFKIPFEDAVKLAHKMGAEGVQIYAVNGDFSPENLDINKIKYYKSLLNDNGLSVSALCGDLGGHGFMIEADNPQKIEKTKRILELAKKFDADIITTHIGVIPEDESTKEYDIMLKALDTLGDFSKAMHSWLAIETGPETAVVLKNFIDKLHGGVGVNFDPANLVMVTGDDPVLGVSTLAKYIKHTHAKDGIMIKQTLPKNIYDIFAGEDPKGFRMDEYFKETPLGEGNVNFDNYIKALKNSGFDGYLTIEREVGENPIADIEKAVLFLKKYI